VLPQRTLFAGKTTIEQRTDAWLAILRAYEAWGNYHQLKGLLGKDLAFVQAYQQQQLDLPNWIYAAVPKLSRNSLKAKQKLRREAPKITALGGNYGHRRGKGKIDSDSELQAAIRACLAAGGKHWGASQIYEILQLEFGLDPADCSIGQLRAWLRQFRTLHPQEWVLYMCPDRAKGLISPAFGSRSQAILRPNHVWEVDTMRVDIECRTELAGTVRLNRVFVIACVDVFTRRVILHVSEQTDAEAICLTIASAILKWGVPEHIRTDHGKEYLSRRVQRFLANLGVDTEDLRCLPGHPEQKPFVERFNRTFQHRDLVKSPFFMGHNVSDRQALRQSLSRDDSCVHLAMSIEGFQRWCELWCVEYEQRPHGRTGIGLEGKSPLEVLAEAAEAGWTSRTIQNPRELDFLRMAAPGKQGMRKVGRQGISIGGRLYVAAELSTWISKSVYACFDPQDPRVAYVYDGAELTQFLCQAVWREAVDVDLAAIARQARHLYEVLLRSVNQIRKRGKALLRKLASDPYLLIGQMAQSLEQVIQSQLHLYPAIGAVTAAITASESTSEESVAIDLETYHRELQRLEAESQQAAIRQAEQRARQQQLEDLVDRWQQHQRCPELESSELETVVQHLNSTEGRGFLMAVTASALEEQQFWYWLKEKPIEPIAIVDRRPLLETALAQWRDRQQISLNDKQSLLHYIGEPEGLGVLRAYTSPLKVT
jgi:transposase InsO family protein